MSKKNRSSDILERMRQTTLREKPSSQEIEAENPSPVPSSPTPSRTDGRRAMLLPQSSKRVRFTLDLNPQQHKFLKRFALEADTDASAVIRAMLAQLEEDEVIAESIRRRIRA